MPYERKTVDIIISDELRDILQEFESDSLVAKLLLKKRHDKESLVEDPINFISVAHDRTKIAYLTSDRIEKLTEDEYWSTSRRFAARPGAFIGKIFKDIPAKEVEKFSNLYRSHVNKATIIFEVIDGVRILKYYHINSYASERGTLGASCMKYDNCQNYLGIYTENPDVVKMLIITNTEGGLLGRALLWHFDNHKIMDRIYTIADEEYAFQMKKWATDNGYLYKSEQNWYNTLNFENLSTTKQELKLDIKLKNSEFRKYPYIDTFKFYCNREGKITNYIPDGTSFRVLCSSEGSTYDYDYLIFDGIDRVLRHPGDTVYINYLDLRTHCNNARWSEINDEYILERHCKYDEEINEYLFNEEYDRYNKVERINERREFLKKRREESEKKESSRKKRSSAWLASMMGGQINETVLNEIYDRVVRNSGIPQGYFTFNHFSETQTQSDSEPQVEPVE